MQGKRNCICAYLEQTKRLDGVALVEGEAMVDACWEDEEVTGKDMHTNPFVSWLVYGNE
jgi:hypothetical protein